MKWIRFKVVKPLNLIVCVQEIAPTVVVLYWPEVTGADNFAPGDVV